MEQYCCNIQYTFCIFNGWSECFSDSFSSSAYSNEQKNLFNRQPYGQNFLIKFTTILETLDCWKCSFIVCSNNASTQPESANITAVDATSIETVSFPSMIIYIPGSFISATKLWKVSTIPSAFFGKWETPVDIIFEAPFFTRVTTLSHGISWI